MKKLKSKIHREKDNSQWHEDRVKVKENNDLDEVKDGWRWKIIKRKWKTIKQKKRDEVCGINKTSRIKEKNRQKI